LLPSAHKSVALLSVALLGLVLETACAHAPTGPSPLATLDFLDNSGAVRTLVSEHGKIVILDVCVAAVDPCLLNARAVSEACDAMCDDEVVMVTLLLDELGARDRTWGPETLDVMTLGTLLHHVMELVFPEGTKMPDQSQISGAVPDALSEAIRHYAPWLSNDAWETERQSLLREAYDVTSNWTAFLHETQAEVLHNEIGLAGDHAGLLLRGNQIASSNYRMGAS